ASPAPTACFEDVNAAGNDYGNCGKNREGSFVKCGRSDAMCGKIQCQSRAESPRERNTVPIDTTVRVNGRDVKCRGTYLYSVENGVQDLPDPGLVKTGTKCGDGTVCKDRRCQNASFLDVSGCLEKCNGHGVCNSNRNCHCNSHWAPPYCDKAGLGGSIDSGPVHRDNQTALLVGLLFSFLLLIPALLLGLYACYTHRAALLTKWHNVQQEWTQLDRTVTRTKNGLSETSFYMANVRQQQASEPARPMQPNKTLSASRDSHKPPRPEPPSSRTTVTIILPNQSSNRGPPRKPPPFGRQNHKAQHSDGQLLEQVSVQWHRPPNPASCVKTPLRTQIPGGKSGVSVSPPRRPRFQPPNNSHWEQTQSRLGSSSIAECLPNRRLCLENPGSGTVSGIGECVRDREYVRNIRD
ncbi:uncharacterized protein LOC144488020, partial [Mustelus asterias]